eukprot:scaffold7749_cov258-Pinguiococcus_pyrenoidosus.AAC.1
MPPRLVGVPTARPSAHRTSSAWQSAQDRRRTSWPGRLLAPSSTYAAMSRVQSVLLWKNTRMRPMFPRAAEAFWRMSVWPPILPTYPF